MHFRGTNTVKTLLMAPKDKDHKLQNSGIMYNYKCPHTNCPEQYIGESGRKLGDKVKEHLRDPSPYISIAAPQGTQSVQTVLTIHRESQGVTWNVKGGHVYKGQ